MNDSVKKKGTQLSTFFLCYKCYKQTKRPKPLCRDYTHLPFVLKTLSQCGDQSTFS